MGAPGLYWWWDVISPVCQPLSSYSYAFHTVGPPRPLIPVSWGGGQTAKQTGGWAAGLFRRCLTRRAWRSILHLQRFQHLLSAWGCKTKGLQKREEIPAPSMWRKSVSSNVQDVFRVQVCGLGLSRLLPKLILQTVRKNIPVILLCSDSPESEKGTLFFLGTSGDQASEYICTGRHLPLFTNKYRKSLCNAFI